MKPKTKLAAPGAPLYDNVASGDTEIGFDQITQVLAEPRVDLVGPLPTAIQNYTRFAAGLVAVSTHQDLGKALISFLSSPAALAVMETKGFEPH